MEYATIHISGKNNSEHINISKNLNNYKRLFVLRNCGQSFMF